MVMSSDADSSTDRKPWLSAFQFAIFCLISTSGRPLNRDFEATHLISEFHQNSQKSWISTTKLHQKPRILWFSKNFWNQKSRFRVLPEVEIQQKIAIWKAESLSFSVSKESAPEDTSIARSSDFESDASGVGRLRRRTAPRSDAVAPSAVI